MNRTAVTAASFTWLIALAPALSQETEAEAKRPYTMSLESVLKMDMGAQGPVEIKAKTGFSYTNLGSWQRFKVQLDRVEVVSLVNGVENMNVVMSGEGYRGVEGGQVQDVPFDAANPELQAMLDASFRSPICAIEVDDEMRVTKLERTAKPGAANLMDNGAVENARFFHAPFPAVGESWEAERVFSMGNGNLAKGKVTYTRGATKDGRVEVTLKGTLTGGGPQGPIEMKNAVYEIEGTQHYDPELHDYVAGQLTIAVCMELTQNGKLLGTTQGTIMATFTKRGE